jgi:anti-sigma B factor antagonist
MEALLKEIEAFNAQDHRISIKAVYCEASRRSLCLHLYGELDNESGLPFEKRITTYLTRKFIPPVLILECSKLNYVSSTGIGVFVNILMQCNRQGIQLYLCALPEKIKNLFSLLGFSSYFTFIDSVSEVIE